MNRIDRLYMEMIHYYQGDPKHIQHFVKVHDLSRLIGQSEGLDEDTMHVLETAALVHDIGKQKVRQLPERCLPHWAFRRG